VLVRLASSPERWNLVVEDDGKGFPFPGRFKQEEMEEMGKGPTIIKDRVRLLAGELTVESSPGQGTRLEVVVPRAGDGPHEY
jgi:signal transduction histidine kinase